MIDSVGFYIQLEPELYQKLMQIGILTQRIDRVTGFVEFEYTNFKANHSFNYRVQWKIDNRHYVKDHDSGSVVVEEGIPYLKLEFSAPKILFGHNLDSITIESMLDACLVVKEKFEQLSGVTLPGPGEWYIYRLDVCANFVLDDLKSVKSYIQYIQRLDYPRRSGNAYKDTGLYFASRYSTLKIYCKGEEFKKHDAVRFCQKKSDDMGSFIKHVRDNCNKECSDWYDQENTVSEIEAYRLQHKANNILRIEVELKRRIAYLVAKHEQEFNETFLQFKGCVSVEDFLYIVDVKFEMERVMQKFLVGVETRTMKIGDVQSILNQAYSCRRAAMLFSIYTIIVLQGQNEAKLKFAKRTYYDALRAFRENNISLICSDVKLDEDFKERPEFECVLARGFPADFSLKMDSSNKYYQLPLVA